MNNNKYKYFHLEDNLIEDKLKILYFCLHIEFFLTKKLTSLINNKINLPMIKYENNFKSDFTNDLELGIDNYPNLKKLFICSVKSKKFRILFSKKYTSKPIRNYFIELSFGEKIFLLSKMKSKYWNKLFSELITKNTNSNNKFSMAVWNAFFRRVKEWRNDASHTNSINKEKFNFAPIIKEKSKIEIYEFITYLEKIYNFNLKTERFFKIKNRNFKK